MCLCRLATRPTFYSNYDEEEENDDDDDDDDDDDERIPGRSDQAFKKMDFVPNQSSCDLFGCVGYTAL